jgi:hypothetical protein
MILQTILILIHNSDILQSPTLASCAL